MTSRFLVKTCKVLGCVKEPCSKGFCGAHHHKFKKYGDPLRGYSRTVAVVDGLKVCSTCGVPQNDSEYYLRKSGKLSGQCKTCKDAKVNKEKKKELARIRIAKSTTEEREGRNSYGRDMYNKSKTDLQKFNALRDRGHFNMVKRRYGLSKEEYSELLESQGGGCDICGEPPKEGAHLGVDHDHLTGKVRGLLCRTCNAAIGMLKDSVGLLQSGIDYLLKFK